MQNIDKYQKKPHGILADSAGRFEEYNLKENPFPAHPFINQESTDVRMNGEIYERSIRKSESSKIIKNFIEISQSNLNHLRLGYIIDTSYIGRGNGKSAFLVNLQKDINKEFCLDISDGKNKCFGLILYPEISGRTKTFDNFVDLFAASIFRSTVLDDALASLRLDAIHDIYKKLKLNDEFENDEDLRKKLSSSEWYSEKDIDYRSVQQKIIANEHLNSLPKEFPLFQQSNLFIEVLTRSTFAAYYKLLKKPKEKLEFVFSHLPSLFLAAGFNGAYIFVDDFERIPDFQSERQKRDFALGLRTVLFDGQYLNARLGFYNFILVLHAGVPSLIKEAWRESGLERRAPISYNEAQKHVIPFEKFTLQQANLLIRKYLNAFRDKEEKKNPLRPFTEDAVAAIAESSQFNAAEILKMAYEVLDRAIEQGKSTITDDFIKSKDTSSFSEELELSGIHEAPTKDLHKDAKKGLKKK